MTEQEAMFEVEEVERVANPTFPVQVTSRVNLVVDVEFFIRGMIDAYVDFEMKGGYQWFERPVLFLHTYLEDVASDTLWWTAEGDIKVEWEDFDADLTHMTEDQVAALHETLGLNREGTERDTRRSWEKE